MFVLDLFWATLCCIGGFALLVVIHELGHLLAMIWVKCSVAEFSIGFGRELIAKTIGPIRWKVCLFPLGGYVRALDRPNSIEQERELYDHLEKEGRTGATVLRMMHDREYLEELSGWKQILVFAMGPAFSFLLGWALLFLVYTQWGAEQLSSPVVVTQFTADSPAELAGIQIGDTIERINDFEIKTRNDLSFAIHRGKPESISLTYRRKDKLNVLEIPRVKMAGIARLGVVFKSRHQRHTLLDASVVSLADSCDTFTACYRMIGLMSVGEISPRLSSGPVGITSIIARVSGSPAKYFYILSAISLSLAAFNLLPIPFFDGGKICGGVLKCCFGDFASRVLKERLTIASVLLFFIVFLAITLSDVARLFGI